MLPLTPRPGPCAKLFVPLGHPEGVNSQESKLESRASHAGHEHHISAGSSRAASREDGEWWSRPNTRHAPKCGAALPQVMQLADLWLIHRSGCSCMYLLYKEYCSTARLPLLLRLRLVESSHCRKTYYGEACFHHVSHVRHSSSMAL